MIATSSAVPQAPASPSVDSPTEIRSARRPDSRHRQARVGDAHVARAAPATSNPGSPWENPWVESYASRIRDELLTIEQFDTLLEAQILIADGRVQQLPPPLRSRHAHAHRVRGPVEADQPTQALIAGAPINGVRSRSPANATWGRDRTHCTVRAGPTRSTGSASRWPCETIGRGGPSPVPTPKRYRRRSPRCHHRRAQPAGDRLYWRRSAAKGATIELRHSRPQTRRSPSTS